MGAGTRAESKRESLDKILDAAARRIREEGLDGAAIVPVMRDAGLTHGAFYSHFSSKDDLANAAFTRAITTGRSHWIKPRRGESWRDRLTAWPSATSPPPIATTSPPVADSRR